MLLNPKLLLGYLRLNPLLNVQLIFITESIPFIFKHGSKLDIFLKYATEESIVIRDGEQI